MGRKSLTQRDRTKVFISYSRHDQEFADALVEALESNDIKVFIDRRDLPLLEEWQRELLEFIHASDTVIFIISPNSINSEWCDWEIEQVSKLNKRLAPIVYQEVPEIRIPQYLSKINYIQFTPQYDFNEQIRGLVEALETDIDWIRKHTQLAERAEQWTHAGSPKNSRLLGRVELAEADDWLANQPRTAPPPRELHRQYIKVSHEARRRRQKFWITGALITAAFFAAIAIFAALNWQRAEENEEKEAQARRQAEKQRDQALIAQSRFLSAQAEESVKTGSPTQAALLAIEALPDPKRGVDRPLVLEAQRQLYCALQKNRKSAVLQFHRFNVSRMELSPDSRRLLTMTGRRGGSQLWDTSTNTRIATFGKPFGTFAHARFSNRGGRFVTWSSHDNARLWDAETGQCVAVFEGATGVISTAKFSPDDALIVTLSKGSKAQLWDGASGESVSVLNGHSKAITHAAFSHKGNMLATASADGTARIWETKTGQLLRTLEGHKNTLLRSFFSADDSRILTLTRDTVRLWDTETAAILGEYQTRGVVLSPDGRHFVTRSKKGASLVFELESGQEIAVLKGGGAVFSHNGEMLATIADDYKSNTYVALLWDARSWKPVTALKGHTSYVREVAFGPRGARIATTSDDHTARLWQADTGKLVAILEGHTAPVVRAVFNHDGGRVLTVTGQETHLPFDYTARLWNAETGEPLAVFDHDSDETKAIFSADGEHIFTIAGGAVHVWQTHAGVGAAVPQVYGKVVGTGKSKDGQILIVSSAPNNIAHILEQDTLQAIATLTGHQGEILSAGFSPNGSLAVTASADRSARVWNALTGDPVATLAGHDNAVTRAVFSPDGFYILTESEEKSARLWDVRAGTEIRRLNCIGSTQKFAVFSPDSKRIAGFCSDEMLHFWDVKTGAEIAQPILGNWVAISPDLAHAVERLNNVEAALRDTTTGAVIKTLDHSNFWAFGGAKFSADGRFLMTKTSGQLPENSAAHIWYAKTGAEIDKFYCPEGVTMGDATFGPRSEHIVTVCYDQTVRVHHIGTRQEIALFPGEPRRVNTHDTRKDGRWMISASFKDEMVFWPVFPTVQGLVDYAKDMLPQCLNESERRRFFLNPEPPDWCIDMGKWPYHPAESKASLQGGDSPEKTPFTKDHLVRAGDDLQR